MKTNEEHVELLSAWASALFDMDTMRLQQLYTYCLESLHLTNQQIWELVQEAEPELTANEWALICSYL